MKVYIVVALQWGVKPIVEVYKDETKAKERRDYLGIKMLYDFINGMDCFMYTGVEKD